MSDGPSGVILRYVGGGAYVVGAPACDLDAAGLATAEAAGWDVAGLLAVRSGGRPVYVEGDTPAPRPVIVIDPNDGISSREASAAGQVLADYHKDGE